MKHNELFTSGQLCRAYRINRVRLNRLIRAGRLNPRKRSRGPGDDNIFCLADFMQLGLLLALDAKGVDHRATATVCDYVRTADLSVQFASGQTLMVIYGEHAFRQLVTLGQLTQTLVQVRQRHGDAFQWDKCKIIDLAGALAEVHRMMARIGDDTPDSASETDSETAAAAVCISGAAE